VKYQATRPLQRNHHVADGASGHQVHLRLKACEAALPHMVSVGKRSEQKSLGRM
jgi:hypothetical protein